MYGKTTTSGSGSTGSISGILSSCSSGVCSVLTSSMLIVCSYMEECCQLYSIGIAFRALLLPYLGQVDLHQAFAKLGFGAVGDRLEFRSRFHGETVRSSRSTQTYFAPARVRLLAVCVRRS